MQRTLELSSLSVGAYHLEKLWNLGLADKDWRGRYKIIKKVKVAELRNYFKIKIGYLQDGFFMLFLLQ